MAAGTPGRAGVPVCGRVTARGDLDHLQKRDRAFLHPGAPGTSGDASQAVSRSAVARCTACGDPLGRGGPPDRTAEEVRTRRPPRPPAARTPGPRRSATDSSRPRLRGLARRPAHGRTTRSSAPPGAAVSQLVNDPSSSTASRSSSVPIRPHPTRLHISDNRLMNLGARVCGSTSKSENGNPKITPVSSDVAIPQREKLGQLVRARETARVRRSQPGSADRS